MWLKFDQFNGRPHFVRIPRKKTLLIHKVIHRNCG